VTALDDRYLNFALFAAYTIASVTGLILLKSNMVAAKGLVVRMDWLAAPVAFALAGAVLYIGSFAVWLVILGRNELSVAYPIAIGLTLVFSTVTASVLLGESLTLGRIVGITMVFLGIVAITRS
jgi:multidrug transporter EmrE-like cation transporter